jgi:hypothetical protein
MITIDELIRQLEELKEVNNLPGDSPVVIDVGPYLTEVEEVDVDAHDESTVVIWCGDRVEG